MGCVGSTLAVRLDCLPGACLMETWVLDLQLNAILCTATFRHLGCLSFRLIIVGVLLTNVNRWCVEVNARARPVGNVSNVSAGLNESVSSMKVVINVGVPDFMEFTYTRFLDTLVVAEIVAYNATVRKVVTVANSTINIVLNFVKLLPPMSRCICPIYSECA